MQGVSFSNILAVASRGFVALYGLIIAYVIEENSVDIYLYGSFLSISLILGAAFSLFVSRLSICNEDYKKSARIRDLFYFDERFSCEDLQRVKINLFLKPFLGIQFVAVTVAYGICFKFPENRLFVISLVPIFSMLGTVITVVLVEPRFAKFIDDSASYGRLVSRVFMEARAFSFFISFFIVLLFLILFAN